MSIAVDLDGTLAFNSGYRGPHEISEPVPLMLARVRQWIANGETVKILTARVSGGDPEGCRPHIAAWLEEHGIGGLEITAEKDREMTEIWDDRAVQVLKNTGLRVDLQDAMVFA